MTTASPRKAPNYRYGNRDEQPRTEPIPVTSHMALVMAYGMAMTRAETAKSFAINKKMGSKAAWSAHYRERSAATHILRELYRWEQENAPGAK